MVVKVKVYLPGNACKRWASKSNTQARLPRMNTHAMPEGPDLPSSSALAASFNHACSERRRAGTVVIDASGGHRRRAWVGRLLQWHSEYRTGRQRRLTLQARGQFDLRFTCDAAGQRVDSGGRPFGS